MRRYKVIFEKYGVRKMESFTNREDAIEFAINKLLDNYYTQVIDNATGEVI